MREEMVENGLKFLQHPNVQVRAVLCSLVCAILTPQIYSQRRFPSEFRSWRALIAASAASKMRTCSSIRILCSIIHCRICSCCFWNFPMSSER
ncbi:hypothetical protein GN958_ATG21078 [Phytophthora infestans]|uniref:Uncharacterized protein n=1 Tax=Phytophthora infestans TaxID=4787 RepID=A0A8S9TNL4_PHYIN|nr:hypothetical protein GN958_ATG21078 [Phytophthora infestans]